MSVDGLAAQAAAFMGRAGYSPGSRASYQRVWDQFGQYCAESGVRSPDREAAARFCTVVGADGSQQWQVFYRRAAGCLFDVAETGRFALRAGRRRIAVPEVFTAEFEVYVAWLAGCGLAEATIRGKTGMLRRLLAFLADSGVWEVAALSVVNVSAYVRSLAPMAASSRAGQLYFLREYLRFAVRQHGADPALGAMFPVIITDKDAVLPSVYRPGEVAGALTEAGNGSESPLRDGAVMVLASVLGLRSSDIKGLRFDQIDWANRRLSLLQRKTGRRLDLPLVDECALAIIDYWKNERPEVDDARVFLRHRAPLQPPVAGNHFHQVVAGCFDRAGVEVSGRHRGLHALRHSVAVGMLEAGSPYPVIGAVLGHVDANTTRRYLRVDVAHLPVAAVAVLLEHANRRGPRDLALITTLYDTAARVQEACDLSLGALHLDKPASATLTRKGRKTRIVPLTPQAAVVLARHVQTLPQHSSAPVFTNRAGQRLGRAGAAYILAECARAAHADRPELIPEKVSPHVLRHSKAMHLLENGVNLIYIRDILGHASVVTTEICAKANPEMKRPATETAAAKTLGPSRYDQATRQDLLAWLRQAI